MMKTYICTTCGSDNVRLNADTAWNVQRQRWEITELFDSSTCEACGCERRLQDVELQDPKDMEEPEGSELSIAARAVLDNWNCGDLAAAVRQLQAAYNNVVRGGNDA